MTMPGLEQRIRVLVTQGDYLVSEHGALRLAGAGVLIERFADRINEAEIVEVYPDYHKGPCVLFLDEDEFGRAMHLLWGIPAGADRPAYLITAYRPDPQMWSPDFRVRRMP